MKYILITAAYNEEKYIRGTIESVINQKRPPEQWVIVNDGSTDETEKIIKEYLDDFKPLTLVKINNKEKKESNLGKVSRHVVACVKDALTHITVNDYQLIGILDSDITFGADYYDAIINKFSENNKLGLGGGFVYNVDGKKKMPFYENRELVSGAIQLFRKECWNEIKGLYPGGHHDYFAIISCKMYGWEVKSFPDPELEVYHHKHASVPGRSQIKAKFHLGCMDYVCGELFFYSLIRALSMIIQKPLLIGSFVRIAGYLYSAILRTPQQVPQSVKKYIKKEQNRKILKIFKLNY